MQDADHEVEEVFRKLRNTAEVVLEDVILHDVISSEGRSKLQKSMSLS